MIKRSLIFCIMQCITNDITVIELCNGFKGFQNKNNLEKGIFCMIKLCYVHFACEP